MSDKPYLFSRRSAVKAAAIMSLAQVRGSAANSAVTVGLIGAGSRGTYVTGLVAKNTPARVVALCDIVDGKGEKGEEHRTGESQILQGLPSIDIERRGRCDHRDAGFPPR